MQRLEGLDVAEEKRLVGGHRFDDLAANVLAAKTTHEVAEIVDRVEPLVAGQRSEASFEQVALGFVEDDAGVLIDGLTQEPQVVGGDAGVGG